MVKNIDSQLHKKYNHENANYYNFPKLDYNKPNAFNQPNNLSKAFCIQDYLEPKYQYCRTQFMLNNKLCNNL